VEVANILEVSDKALEYIVSTKHIASRGDTLNSTLLTFNISSPVDDVIKVRLEHHRGPRELGPTFELFPDGQPSAPKTKIAHPDKEYVTFPSATLSVDLNTAPYSYGLTFRGDSTPNVIYRLSLHTSRYSPPIRKHCCPVSDRRRRRPFHVERVHPRCRRDHLRLGERFGPFKNGQNVGIWNQDGGRPSRHTRTYRYTPHRRGTGCLSTTARRWTLRWGGRSARSWESV